MKTGSGAASIWSPPGAESLIGTAARKDKEDAMPADPGLLALQRDDLAGIAGVTEKTMFGGVAFLLHGNMLCGVHSRAAMYRVGKARMDAALALPGVGPMAFTGRPIGGFVEAGEDAMADDAVRLHLRDMARAFVASLPPK
jgi:hypothetical protein